MRVAVIADIHGNLPALDAALRGVAHEGVDATEDLVGCAMSGMSPHASVGDHDAVSVSTARREFLHHFSWRSGHADVWPVFAHPTAFAAIVEGLVEPWRTSGVTKVLGIESRGFLLGGAAALRLGTGFVAVRKGGGLLPGPKVTVEAPPDYRGIRHILRMQNTLTSVDRVLLVDDWAGRGSQALAARHLVKATGAEFLGASLLVDQLSTDVRATLGDVTSLVTADELGPAVE